MLVVSMSWKIGEVVSRDRGGSREGEGFLGSCGEKWKLRFPAKVMKTRKRFWNLAFKTIYSVSNQMEKKSC